ncbi:MAG TPA: YjgN family protein [Gammaproteobacteria bacterium]|nr:YjgN family protein [Gammaproteobacteria bacterium]
MAGSKSSIDRNPSGIAAASSFAPAEPESAPAETLPGACGKPYELPLEFRGSVREYFRIWIVNLCLTLLTLGVFSAWAKVRKKRYFYSSITIDETPFQYLAEPVPILKGRIIAVVLFTVYWFSSSFYLPALPWVLGAGLIIAPWVVSRSAAFNAHYSAFRNMTFHFGGNYLGAAQAIYWLGLIPFLVIGTIFEWWGYWQAAGFVFLASLLLFPWWLNRIKRYMVSYASFGGAYGQYSASGRQFFRVYFIAGLIAFASGIISGVIALLVVNVLSINPDWSVIVISTPGYLGYMLGFAYVQANINNLVWNHTRFGPLRFKSTLTGGGMGKLYFTNAAGIIASLGLLTPWAVMRTLKYRADNMRVLVDGELQAMTGGKESAVQAAGAELGAIFDMDLSL